MERKNSELIEELNESWIAAQRSLFHTLQCEMVLLDESPFDFKLRNIESKYIWQKLNEIKQKVYELELEDSGEKQLISELLTELQKTQDRFVLALNRNIVQLEDDNLSDFTTQFDNIEYLWNKMKAISQEIYRLKNK